MGVDIGVWRARIGSFNASVRRWSSKRAKQPVCRAGKAELEAVVMAVLLLIMAGGVEYSQHQNTTVVGSLDTTLMSKTVPLSPSGHPVTEKQQLSVCDVYSTQFVYCVDRPNRELYFNELVLRERVQTKAIMIIPHSVGVTEQQCVVTVQYTALQPVGTTISEALGLFDMLKGVVVVLVSLLILAGDVELNPGPGKLVKTKGTPSAGSAVPEQEKTSVCDVFRAHYSRLLRGVTHPTLLAADLFSAGLISESVNIEISTTTGASDIDRASVIMRELGARFGVDPHSKELMEQLCTVIEEHVTLQPVALSIRKALGATLTPESLLQFSTMTVKLQPTDPVTSYAQYLKYRYRQSLPDDDKLLTTPSKYYIELAVISSECISSRKSADEFTRKTLHGLTEEIMCRKTPIALENILKPGEDGKPVRCVLIEGAPGAGKSTLAWELCHKWEELECTKHCNLVVLIQLREKRAQEATQLSHLFPKSGSNMDDILASIGNGQGILVILDGFDELPHEQREESSVYIKLIKGVDLLPEATVVITSRPSVSADLLRLCKHGIDKHLEVLGFTPEQIEKYAGSVFCDGDELKSFIQYINSNPVIKGLMYLPLNAVIVTSVFKYSRGHYSKTMTQLYDALTRSLIRRYLAEQGMVSADYRMPDSLLNRESINKLPTKVAEQLVVVARVAYMGLCEDKYVFIDLGVEFNNLGMMKKTTSLDMFGPTCSFSFLHLTLQEYLSALYISLELYSGLRVHYSVCENNIVIRFLAGLCEVCAHGNDNVYQALGSLLQVNNLESLLVVQCLFECRGDSIVQNIKVLQELFVSDKLIFVVGGLPFDYYLVGHCISRIGGRWSISIKQQEEVDLLIQGLGSYGTCSRGKIQELLLYGNALLTFDPLVKLCCHDLHSLALEEIRFTKSDAALLREYISPGRVLKVVNMIVCRNVDTVLPIVFGASSLYSLEFSSKINTHSLNLLSDNLNLKKLRLHVGKFDVFEQLAAALHNNTSLTLLGIGLSHKPVAFVPIFIKLLLSNHTLQELEVLHTLELCQGDIDAMVQLVEVAANSTSLKKLTCDKRVYKQFKSHVPKQYQYILHEGKYGRFDY